VGALHWGKDRSGNSVVIAGLDPAIHHDEMGAWLYILANKPGGTLYVGVANDLIRRVFEHRQGSVEGFTKRHNVKMLVYYEQHETVPLAIQREKNIKHWSREWKIDLIVSLNPEWRDLYAEICR
jgi:putative endonuclease